MLPITIGVKCHLLKKKVVPMDRKKWSIQMDGSTMMILEVMVVTKMAICLIHHRKQQVNLYREKPYLFNKAKAAVREAVTAAAAMVVPTELAVTIVTLLLKIWLHVLQWQYQFEKQDKLKKML